MLSRRSTFPRRGPVSERVFGKAYQEAEHGGTWLAAGLFAIALFLLVASLSIYEITRPDRAQAILSAGIASLTDIDQTLEENIPLLREEARSSAEAALEMPGYPIPATLTRVEALTADTATIRALLLSRSAKLVYATGLDAFDETGEQSSDLFSISTVIRELVGFLTGDVHGRAQWVAIVSLVAATVLGATTLALNRGFARFTTFGLAVLLAAAPGYFVARGGSELIARFGSGDAFVIDLQMAVLAMLDVPERNFLIAGSLGLNHRRERVAPAPDRQRLLPRRGARPPGLRRGPHPALRRCSRPRIPTRASRGRPPPHSSPTVCSQGATPRRLLPHPPVPAPRAFRAFPAGAGGRRRPRRRALARRLRPQDAARTCFFEGAGLAAWSAGAARAPPVLDEQHVEAVVLLRWH